MIKTSRSVVFELLSSKRMHFRTMLWEGDTTPDFEVNLNEFHAGERSAVRIADQVRDDAFG